MMNYNYPITDPKTLKLGIKYALYPRPKYNKKEWSLYHGTNGEFNKESFERYIKAHEQSRIAYLKEREFKVGDVVYYKDKPNHSWYTKLKLGKRYNKLSWRFNALDGSKGFGIIEEIKITHYYPGQQVESFKYVKERLINIDACPLFTEWQEVEEPDNCDDLYNATDIDWDGNDRNIFLEDRFNEDLTQFQEDVDEGKILAITKQ